METRRSKRLHSKDSSIPENGSESPAPKQKRTSATKSSEANKNMEKKPRSKLIKSTYFEDVDDSDIADKVSKTRPKKTKSSYFESPVNSGSESDYEPEPPVKTGGRSRKNRQPAYESDSSSSDSESVKKRKIILPNRSRMINSNLNQNNAQKIKNSYESESDSSSDEFVKAPESLLNLAKTDSVRSSSTDQNNVDEYNEVAENKPTEYFDFSSLVSQVTEATKAAESPAPINDIKPPADKQKLIKGISEKKPKRGKKLPKKETASVEAIKPEQLEVCELLAMGEDTDLTAKDIKETVCNSTEDYEIPNQVEVLLDAPALMKKKRCNDLEMALRRRLNNIKRENQVYVHKVHVLCYIAHGNYLNTVLNSSDVLSVALSLLPSEKCYPPKRMNMEYLEDLLNWFCKKIKMKKENIAEESKDLNVSLQTEFQKLETQSKTRFCFMFLCLLRALGIRCRLVINLNVLPIKPTSDQLLPVNQKTDEPKPTPNAVKKEKTPAKSNSRNKNNEKSQILETTSGQKKKKINSASSSKSDEKKKNSVYFKAEAKPTRKSSRQTQSNSKYFEEDDETKPKSNKRKSPKQKKKTNEEPLVQEMSSTDESDFEDAFVSPKKKKIDRRVLSSEEDTVNKVDNKPKPDSKNNYWIEVFLEAEEKWFCVDVAKKSYHCIKQLYSNATHPVRYLLGWNNDQTIKDVTRRYVPQYLSVTRKLRVDDNWWKSTMKPYEPPPTPLNKEEDEELDKILEELPIPASISECKNHPLYALKRHLLKFQGIYPPDAIPVGYIKGEPVYSRLCVQQLHGREMWIKEAKVVKIGETPYKIVKGRPQKSKFGTSEPPKDLELFGLWQVEDYVPPTAENGKVPRNAFGNVELFKPSMLPKGTVYLQLPGLQRIANKLNIDCAAAITGFEYSTNGWSYPVKDGFVVCEEFKDILLDAYNQEIEEAEKKERQKREERVYANWKRLIKGLFIREKLKRKYNFGDPETSTSKANVKKGSD